MNRWISTVWRLLREISGEAAYERYLVHWRVHHAGEPPLSRADFFKAQQERKWSGIKRCC